MMKCLPWQAEQWQRLWQCRQNNRLPHALLLVGACDLEKKQFAEVLSAAMICEAPDTEGYACLACHACHLVLAKSHPDLIFVEPEQSSQVIKIDQIRDIVHQATETAMQGGYRVIVIFPAHAMNISAANALLKTLEEPAPQTLLILVSDQSSRLVATITSRCQKIIFPKPPHELALTWLQESLPAASVAGEAVCELLLTLAAGAPLKALALVTEDIMALRQSIYQGLATLSQGQADPLELAAKWQEYDMLMIVKLLLSWLRDMLRFKLTAGQAEMINSDYQKDFAKIANKLTQEHLLSYLDTVQQSYARMVNLLNLNKQLLLEELLIRWTKLYVSC